MLLIPLLLLAAFATAAKDSIGSLWKELDALHEDGDIGGVQRLVQEHAESLGLVDSARLLRQAVAQWEDARYVAAVAAAVADTIAEDPKAFRIMALELATAFSHVPVTELVVFFVAGKEKLLDSSEWLSTLLATFSSGAARYYEGLREAGDDRRQCRVGQFPVNLAWMLTTFPEYFVEETQSVAAWYTQMAANLAGVIPKDPEARLKLSYAQLHPILVMLTIPDLVVQDIEAVSSDREYHDSPYAVLPLEERLEVFEFYLSRMAMNDRLTLNGKNLNEALVHVLYQMVLPRTIECKRAIDFILRTDAFRTLSLVLQLGRCKHAHWPLQLLTPQTLSGSPYSLAVLLEHGDRIGQDGLVSNFALGSLGKFPLVRSMLSFRPKARLLNPCRSKYSPRKNYKWSLPGQRLLQHSLIGNSQLVFLARHMLYSQFAVPFDATEEKCPCPAEGEASASTTSLIEEFLERQANQLLGSYCSSLGKKQGYYIKAIPMEPSTDLDSLIKI